MIRMILSSKDEWMNEWMNKDEKWLEKYNPGWMNEWKWIGMKND